MPYVGFDKQSLLLHVAIICERASCYHFLCTCVSGESSLVMEVIFICLASINIIWYCWHGLEACHRWPCFMEHPQPHHIPEKSPPKPAAKTPHQPTTLNHEKGKPQQCSKTKLLKGPETPQCPRRPSFVSSCSERRPTDPAVWRCHVIWECGSLKSFKSWKRSVALCACRWGRGRVRV